MRDSSVHRLQAGSFTGSSSRTLLSVPHMGGTEKACVGEAFASNWLSTVGPNLAAFERGRLVGAPKEIVLDYRPSAHLLKGVIEDLGHHAVSTAG